MRCLRRQEAQTYACQFYSRSSEQMGVTSVCEKSAALTQCVIWTNTIIHVSCGALAVTE